MQSDGNDGAAGSLGDELLAESQKPLTMKDRFVGVFIALVMFGLAAGMFIRPVLLGGAGDDLGGRKTRGYINLIEMVWSRPVGGVLILLGLLVLFGALTKKSAAPAK